MTWVGAMAVIGLVMLMCGALPWALGRIAEAAKSSAAPRPAPDDHPGGPLSRAERVLLSNMKREVHRARLILAALTHVMGAVPGTQKIEAARLDALNAIGRMLDAFRSRKDGAPMPEPEVKP